MSRTGLHLYASHLQGWLLPTGVSAGDAMGGDGQLIAGKIELITEDNQHWSTRLVYAKVNPENQSINKAFPHADTPERCSTGLERGCLSVGSTEHFFMVYQR